MLMAIWTFVIVVTFVFLAGFAAFLYGFYSGMDYVNLTEDDIKHNESARKLARVGSWIIEHVNM